MNEILYVPEPKRARVEIIPLIDVIFFLLATFVLFTLSLDKISSLPAALPAAGIPGESDNVFIQASADGVFYWKQGSSAPADLITAAELGPRLAEYRRTSAHPSVFVRGDNQAKFGPAVKVLDEVRKAGITQVSIETKPSPTAK